MSILATRHKQEAQKPDASVIPSALATEIDLTAALNKWVLAQSNSIQIVLDAHITERKKRSEGRAMLGLYTPFFIGSLFSISESAVRAISRPWILMYEYSLILDDLIDTVRVNRSEETVLSQLLLTSALSEFKGLAGNGSDLWRAFNTCHCEWLGAMLEQDWEEYNSALLNESAVLQHGKKASIAKFCAQSLLLMDKGRLLSPREDVALDYFCAGVQLLDDVADVIEDLREHRASPLLRQIDLWNRRHRFGNVNRDSIHCGHTEMILNGLVYSGAVSRTWRAAAKCFDFGLTHLAAHDGDAFLYFADLAARCRFEADLLESDVSELKTLNPGFAWVAELSIEDPLGSHDMFSEWRRAMKRIEAGPKCSQ